MQTVRDLEKLPCASMQRRLVINQLLVIVVFAAFALANVVWGFFRQDSGEFDQLLRVQAQATLDASEHLYQQPQAFVERVETVATFARNNLALMKTSQPFGQSSFDLLVRVLDPSGKELYALKGLTPPPWPYMQPGQQTVTVAGVVWRVHSLHSTRTGLTMQVAETSASAERDLATALLRYLGLPLMVFLPIAGLTTWWASRRGLRPLHDLAALIARRSPQDLQPLEPVASFVETAPLVSEINTLLHKLKATLSRERHFLADAAHELRTPLAVVQAQVHVLQNASSAAERAACAEELNVGIARAAALIQKLLLTARVSSDDFAPHLEAVDLTAFTQERVALLSALAAQKNIDLELQAQPRVQAHIDRETFASALDNVIDNAIRYTPKGGAIVVAIDSAQAGGVALRVADNGVGITPELRDRVFERFYRINGSEQPGSGLGLSIVKRVLALHGGSVTLSTGLNQTGLAVALVLPHARASASLGPSH
jgi:signal transduction histidine kinase